MIDLISRQAAIEALIDAGILNYDATGDGNGMIHAINVIKGLPPAEPERKKGRWILEWENEDTRMMRCSECRMVFNVGTGREGYYCPNCGARMYDPKESEVQDAGND